MRNIHALLLLPILSMMIGSAAQAQHAFQEMFPNLVSADRHPTVQLPDGGFCILAREQTPEDYGSRFIIIKTNTDGLVEWSYRFATPGSNDYPTALRQTPDGGFYALGTTSVPDEWNQNILLIRLNAHGYPLWSKMYDYSPLDWGGDIALLEDGSAVVVGSTQMDDTIWNGKEFDGEGYIDQTYDSDGYGDDTYSEESDDPSYNIEEREVPLFIRIDPEGEVAWGRTMQFPYRTEEELEEGTGLERSFCETVCSRDAGTVSMVIESLDQGLWSSMLLDVSTKEGTVKQTTKLSTWEPESFYHFSTLVNDIAPLPNGELAIGGLTGVPPYFTDAAFLARVDKTNTPIWLRTYTNEEKSSPLSLSVLPVEEGFILGGRTIGMGDDYVEYNNPMIARADKGGSVVEAREWTASAQNFALPGESKDESASTLGHPIFVPTDDGGIVSTATIYTTNTADGDEYVPDRQSMLISRFTPDLTTCGDHSTENVEPKTIVEVGKVDADLYYDYQNAWGYDAPVDALSADYRYSTYQPADMEMINVPVSVDMAVPEPYDESEISMPKASYDDYGDMTVKTPEPEYGMELNSSPGEILMANEADDIRVDTARVSDWGEEFSIATPPPTMEMSQPYSDEIAMVPAAPAPTAADTIGYILSSVDTAYIAYDDTYDDAEYVEPEIGPQETLIPTFSKTEMGLVDLTVTAQTLAKVEAEEFEVEPIILCQENAMISASTGPSDERPVESEFLHLLPNTIQSGKTISAEFTLSAEEKPEVSIINIARGEVVRQMSSKNVSWTSTNGRGTASVETSGLTTGTYLVRIRAGEKQLTAKLEVQ